MIARMTRPRLAKLRAASAAALLLAPTNFLAAQEPKLHSVKVELPADSGEFAGAGSEAVNGICLACHSTEMVLMQPKLSAAAWTAEVNKMRAVYKAPIADADVAGLVDYLVRLQNPG